MNKIIFNLLFDQNFSIGALATVLSIKRFYPESIININYKNVIQCQLDFFQELGCDLREIPDSSSIKNDVKRYKPDSILNLSKYYDISQVHKIIQIDTDFILTGDIDEMISSPKNKICGCVNDVITKYMNSGLMVFNLEYFYDYIIKWKELIAEKPNLFKHYNWYDQGHFNVVTNKKDMIFFDGSIYNLVQLRDVREGKFPDIYRADGKLQRGIHFTGKNKPWKSSSHKHQTFYREYFYKLLLSSNINILDLSHDYYREFFNKHEQNHNESQIALNSIISYAKQFNKYKLNIYSDFDISPYKEKLDAIGIEINKNNDIDIAIQKNGDDIEKINPGGILISFAPKETHEEFYNKHKAWNLYDRWYCFKEITD